jgi:homoserine dehydrogenase
MIVGFGNVGRSFLSLISDETKRLCGRFDCELDVVAVFDRKGGAVDLHGLDAKALLKTKKREGTVAATPNVGVLGLSPLSAIKEVGADTVLELTPTNSVDGEPAINHIETALRNGKHVITTNKSATALAMQELQELASLNEICFRFSGTVGGGTPILEFVRQIAEVDELLSLKAILNGTTNYILSRMYDIQMPMEKALKQAQHLGYAEEDSSLDIKGIDSALKLAIIANYALERKITLKDIKTTGITNVSVEEVQKNKRQGRKLKLICSIDTQATVAPEPIEAYNKLCVDGSLNSVQLKTKYTGEVNLIGPGAGGYQTATAILSDIIAIERMRHRHHFRSWKRKEYVYEPIKRIA